MHAYRNVEFYRRAFDEAGVHPDDLKSLDDLARFPFTMKSDLRDNYPVITSYSIHYTKLYEYVGWRGGICPRDL